MADIQLKAIIEAQDNASATLKKISGQLEKLGSSMDKTSKQGDGFSNSLKKIATTGAILAVAWKAFNFLESSAKQFREAESAMSALANITNNATGATREQVQALFDQAKALEQVGVIDATSIMRGQAKLATFDLQTSAIKKLTPALLDLVVGEYGLNASSEQVINTANGVGKALQGNVELFTKQGFTVSLAQRELLKYGDESQRVATINEILGTTYNDLNEKASKTAEGSLVQMKNRLNAVKEEIGKALTPTIGFLINELVNTMSATDGASTTFAQFGEVVYRTTNFLLGLGKSVKTGVLTVVGSLDVGITKLFNKEKADEKARTWGETLISSAESTMNSLKEFATASKFKMPEFNLFGKTAQKTGLGGVINIPEVDTEKIKEKLEDLGKTYIKFAEDADDSLFQLSQSHKENLTNIQKSISETRAKMSELREEYEKSKVSDIKSIAKEVVANELQIADIQKQMQEDISLSRYNELKDELIKKQQAIQDNAGFISSIQSEVDEARRVAGLSELQKAIEDFNAKRVLADQEFGEKMSKLQLELKAQKNKLKEENELYKQKVEFIQQLEKESTLRHEELAKQNLKITKETIEKEMEYYKQLASAISSARSGNSAEVSRAQAKVTNVNDAIITPDGIFSTHPDDFIIATKNPENLGGGKSINININGAVFSQESATMLGDIIINQLRTQMRF